MHPYNVINSYIHALNGIGKGLACSFESCSKTYVAGGDWGKNLKDYILLKGIKGL